MKLKILLLLCFACLIFSEANATVVTFESLYPGYEAADIAIPAGYGGLNWSSAVLGITKYYHLGSGYDYGTIGNMSSYTGWSNDINFSSATPFTFNGAYITAAWDANEYADVEGWRNGSMAYTQRIFTHKDAPYWFDFNFANVDTVWIRPIGEQLAIDNITYNSGSVIPEPATMSLLGLGLLGLLGFKKRSS